MRIVYIANIRFPTEKAHGYQIAKMCEEFARTGAEVELWAPTRKNHIREDPFRYYGLEKNFRVRTIRSFDFLPWHRFIGPLAFWLQSAAYLARLAFTRLDAETVVYARQPEIAWLFSRRGYRTVFETHRWPARRIRTHMFLIRNTVKIIALTEGLRKLYLRRGFPERRILVAPDGVDLDVFDLALSRDEARREVSLPHEGTFVGYTGNFHTMGEGKGLDVVFRALALLTQSGENVFFVAVGGTKDDIAFYTAKAAEFGVFERVMLRERVDLKAVARYQKACDVLLMPFPSTEHYAHYMSPMKMFEYMAAQRPIITSDLPSVREVLNDQNALFCRPDDPKDLAEKIRTLLANAALGERLASQAHRDVQKYTWENRTERILAFLEI